jgi:hypothetical protein
LIVDNKETSLLMCVFDDSGVPFFQTLFHFSGFCCTPSYLEGHHFFNQFIISVEFMVLVLFLYPESLKKTRTDSHAEVVVGISGEWLCF